MIPYLWMVLKLYKREKIYLKLVIKLYSTVPGQKKILGRFRK